MKRGFSLITAIIFMVLLATLGALGLSLSTQGVKQTTDIYLKTQAEFLARSVTEYAIMAVSAHEVNAANGCLNQVTASYPSAGASAMFNMRVDIRYFGNGLPGGCNTMADNVLHADSNRVMQFDTYVWSVNNVSTEPIRFHRRTIQRP